MTRRFQITFDVEVDILKEKYQGWTPEEIVSVFGDISFGTTCVDAYKVHSVTAEEKAVA